MRKTPIIYMREKIFISYGDWRHLKQQVIVKGGISNYQVGLAPKPILCLLTSLSLGFLICKIRDLDLCDSFWSHVRPGLIAQTSCLHHFNDAGLFTRRNQDLLDLFVSGQITCSLSPMEGFLGKSPCPQHLVWPHHTAFRQGTLVCSSSSTE